jgi:hypothetical protein
VRILKNSGGTARSGHFFGSHWVSVYHSCYARAFDSGVQVFGVPSSHATNANYTNCNLISSCTQLLKALLAHPLTL